MSSVESAVETALYSALTAGTTVSQVGGTAAPRVYNQIAPPGTAYPYIVFAHAGGGDLSDTPTRAAELLYQVGVFDSSLARGGTVDGLIETDLNGATLTIAGWSNYWCARGESYRLSEVVGGSVIYHVGATYRLGMDET